MSTCANPQPARGASLKAEQMEALLCRLHALPPGSPEANAAEGQLALAVRGYVVKAAASVARKYSVPVEDLVQEGLVATFRAWRGFTPGRVPGRCLYPGYVRRLALQAMNRAAMAEVAPVHLTRTARRKVARAKRKAQAEGKAVAAVLEEAGMPASELAVLGGGTVHAALPVDALLGLADVRGEAEGRLEMARRAVDALGQLERLQRYVLMGLMGLGRPNPVREVTLAAELHTTKAAVVEMREAGLRALRRALEPPKPRATTRTPRPAPTAPARQDELFLGPLFGG